ncbi:MAG: hypothetical protein DRQ51_10680 [Gammaproteobacteria bacterium]|nr:MAG: hypothetical protein DRQ51_10680 [Gammaproteobacteria bacterium]
MVTVALKKQKSQNSNKKKVDGHDFENKLCAIASEKSLSKQWLSSDDEKLFAPLQNDYYLNSILIK